MGEMGTSTDRCSEPSRHQRESEWRTEHGGGRRLARGEKPESFREEEALQQGLEGEMLTRQWRGGRECPGEITLTARGWGGGPGGVRGVS